MKFRTNSFKYLLFALFLACNSTPKEEVPLDKIDLKLDFSRFDLRLAEAAKAIQQDSSLADTAVYSRFLKADRRFVVDWFFGGYDSIASDSLAAVGFVEMFLRNQKVMELLDSVEVKFPENTDFEKLLTDPFKRFSFYFPDKKIQSIRSYVSGYQNSAASGTDELYFSKDFIGIGLHYFLGPDCPWYPPDLPAYMRKRFDKRFMEILIFKGLADNSLQKKMPETNPPRLIDEMIHAGIKLYFVEKMLPYHSDSLKIFYTSAQWDWANFYEGRIYKEVLPHLYESNHNTVQNFIGESPYTKGLDMESAPRIGEFCGWRIVRNYMKNHPEISLTQLMQSPDVELILKESKYRPKSE